jgi:hypothetical protein
MKASRAEGAPEAGVPGSVGREMWSEKQARELLVEQQKSGRGMAEFARERGFSPKRLYWWKGRLAKGDARVSASKAATLLPVRVVRSRRCAGVAVARPRPAASSSLEVVVGAGRVIRVGRDFDSALLCRLVRALEQEGSC